MRAKFTDILSIRREAIWHVHGMSRLQRRSPVQDDPQTDPEAAAEAAATDWGGLSSLWQATRVAAGRIRRVCFLFRLPEM